MSVSHAIVVMPQVNTIRPGLTLLAGRGNARLFHVAHTVRCDFCFAAQASEAAKLRAKTGILLHRIGRGSYIGPGHTTCGLCSLTRWLEVSGATEQSFLDPRSDPRLSQAPNNFQEPRSVRSSPDT